jgi:hypothetical protein
VTFCRGPRLLDQVYQPLLEQPSYPGSVVGTIDERSLPILDVLLGRLTQAGGGCEEAADVAAPIAEGLAKLLLRQELSRKLPGTQPHLEAAEMRKVFNKSLQSRSIACLPLWMTCRSLHRQSSSTEGHLEHTRSLWTLTF